MKKTINEFNKSAEDFVETATSYTKATELSMDMSETYGMLCYKSAALTWCNENRVWINFSEVDAIYLKNKIADD